MAEGELEQHEKDVVAVIRGSGGIGNPGHGSLKNGFKEMAPAEVLLQSAVDSNGNLKRNAEQQQHGKAASDEVAATDEGGKLKDRELKGLVDKQQQEQQQQQQKGFSKEQVHDLKALLQALTLISRNLPLPGTLLGDVQSISYPPEKGRGGQNGVNNGDTTQQQVFLSALIVAK